MIGGSVYVVFSGFCSSASFPPPFFLKKGSELDGMCCINARRFRRGRGVLRPWLCGIGNDSSWFLRHF